MNSYNKKSLWGNHLKAQMKLLNSPTVKAQMKLLNSPAVKAQMKLASSSSTQAVAQLLGSTSKPKKELSVRISIKRRHRDDWKKIILKAAREFLKRYPNQISIEGHQLWRYFAAETINYYGEDVEVQRSEKGRVDLLIYDGVKLNKGNFVKRFNRYKQLNGLP